MYVDSLSKISKEKWYTKSELDDLNHFNKKCEQCLTELTQIRYMLIQNNTGNTNGTRTTYR